MVSQIDQQRQHIETQIANVRRLAVYVLCGACCVRVWMCGGVGVWVRGFGCVGGWVWVAYAART